MLKIKCLISAALAATFLSMAIPAHAGHWVMDHIKVVTITPLVSGAGLTHSDVYYHVGTSGAFQTTFDGGCWAESAATASSRGSTSTGNQFASLSLLFEVKYYVNWVADYPGETMPGTVAGTGTIHEAFDRNVGVAAEIGVGGTAYGGANVSYAGIVTSDSFANSASADLTKGFEAHFDPNSGSNSGQYVFGFGINTDVGESGTHVSDNWIGSPIGSVTTTANATAGSGGTSRGNGEGEWNMTGYLELQKIENQTVGS